MRLGWGAKIFLENFQKELAKIRVFPRISLAKKLMWWLPKNVQFFRQLSMYPLIIVSCLHKNYPICTNIIASLVGHSIYTHTHETGFLVRKIKWLYVGEDRRSGDDGRKV